MKTGWKTLVLTLLALAFSGNAPADEISLGDLLDGGTIDAGDKRLSGWELLFDYSFSDNGDISPDLDAIMVSSLDDGGLLDPGPGIRFDYGDEFAISGDGILALSDLEIGFWVDVLADDLLIKDVSLGLTGGTKTLAGNNGSILNAVVSDMLGGELANLTSEFSYCEAGLCADDAIDITDVSDRGDFSPVDRIWVDFNIGVFAEGFEEFAALNSAELRFSQVERVVGVPEPSSLALLGLGLLGVGVARRRRMN